VTAYRPDAAAGWDWAVREVRLLAQGEEDESDGLDWVREVARLVGRLHIALATEGIDHAGAAEAADWLARAEADLAAADLEPALAVRAASRIRILGRSAGTPIMDVHGDLHIGQVLATGDPRTFYVIDFEGNPMQDSAERLSRQPAARDVAGMLASLDHVGRVVLHRTEGLHDDAAGRVHRWIDLAQQAFLAEYRATLADAGRASLLDVSLLDAMQVQQECREYAYAARYLPHWRYVPDAALPALLARTPVETESP
jgi:maltokinase